MNKTQNAFVIVLLLAVSSAWADGTNQLETIFKQYCETNTWYFSKIKVLPLTIPGFERKELSNNRQAFFKTPAGTDLIYSEYELIKIKAIEIKGDFKRIEGTDDIFIHEDTYTHQYTNIVLVMAAFDSRLFQIDSRNLQQGKTQALADATALARMILENWKKKK